MNQAEKAAAFAALHIAGTPLILANAWDAASARAAERAGARAIATASWAVSAAHGFEDGERLPWELARANLARIVAVTALPVTADLERGYGDTPAAVAATVTQAIAAGAVGCNIEDAAADQTSLMETDEAAARLSAARTAAQAAGISIYINARVDIFLQAPRAEHDAAMVDRALERGRAYAGAGASGLFLPGLLDEALIERACRASPLPVNVMMRAEAPTPRRLAELGVARISHGPGGFLAAMAAFERYAAEALG